MLTWCCCCVPAETVSTRSMEVIPPDNVRTKHLGPSQQTGNLSIWHTPTLIGRALYISCCCCCCYCCCCCCCCVAPVVVVVAEPLLMLLLLLLLLLLMIMMVCCCSKRVSFFLTKTLFCAQVYSYTRIVAYPFISSERCPADSNLFVQALIYRFSLITMCLTGIFNKGLIEMGIEWKSLTGSSVLYQRHVRTTLIQWVTCGEMFSYFRWLQVQTKYKLLGKKSGKT